jgi:putative transposase
MLTRLQVSGFKNLVDVDVRFGPFTCIAGANGVGKSNLFDAIRFLSALADRPLIEAALSVREESGLNTDVRSLFHHVGDAHDRLMSFVAEMIVPQAGFDDLGQQAKASITFLRYSLSFGTGLIPRGLPRLGRLARYASCMSTQSTYIHKSHNVSLLLYHLVCPTKYRRAVVNQNVEAVLRDACLDIAERYEIAFLEIGTDKDHVHFLIQSVPTYSPSRIARIVKSLTAREVFARVPSVKKSLWGGSFWISGFFINTVGRHGSEDVIRRYVQNQGSGQGSGQVYQVVHAQQLNLFDEL